SGPVVGAGLTRHSDRAMYGYPVPSFPSTRRRLSLLAVVIAFVVLAVGEALPTYAQQDAEIDFDGCGNGWECGTLTVPLDYNDPGGRTIEIAVSRLPADDGDDRIGVLMTNPGGPGAGGIGFARAWARLLDDD